MKSQRNWQVFKKRKKSSCEIEGESEMERKKLAEQK
jgi:hypothetical protein